MNFTEKCCLGYLQYRLSYVVLFSILHQTVSYQIQDVFNTGHSPHLIGDRVSKILILNLRQVHLSCFILYLGLLRWDE